MSISVEREPRFEKEAKGKSETAYFATRSFPTILGNFARSSYKNQTLGNRRSSMTRHTFI